MKKIAIVLGALLLMVVSVNIGILFAKAKIENESKIGTNEINSQVKQENLVTTQNQNDTQSKQNSKLTQNQSKSEFSEGKKLNSYDMDKNSLDNSTNGSSNNSSIENKTAGNASGSDWMKMTSSQKSRLVSSVIRSWKSNGIKVDVGDSWFIDALDSFYGDDYTNGTNVAEAMSLSGAVGNVLHQ
ncbi:hypothetical protein HBE96_17620 [Clostridium sp. P21]|uniref:Uncharacterized protein n=1 Tax=Clostridium muellerianum TaxID=2716538 RepID=A0A7Y0HNX5_9CLOT|nr:hypothetical protein [Clostridium muellerianum]NMM64439.1 hypothetical protein [Clostridium muellerianum]